MSWRFAEYRETAAAPPKSDDIHSNYGPGRPDSPFISYCKETL
jgi:hypothetical protein